MDTGNYRNCPIGKYHDFRVLKSPVAPKDSRQYLEGNVQREECKFCKEIKEYRFDDDGKMAGGDRQYFLDHIRAFAQPSMACYYEINPDASFVFEAEAKEVKRSEDYQADKSERFKSEIKKILK